MSGTLHRAVKGKTVGGSKRGKLHRAVRVKTAVGSEWYTAQGRESENGYGQ